ncbi:MAG: hypothetical protein KDB07_01870 [Planctomycetes bacterium]|nr:hypothetical protein [Planctomycetota bacterium]
MASESVLYAGRRRVVDGVVYQLLKKECPVGYNSSKLGRLKSKRRKIANSRARKRAESLAKAKSK